MPLLESLKAGWTGEPLTPEQKGQVGFADYPAALSGLLGNYMIRQPFESLIGLGDWLTGKRYMSPEDVSMALLDVVPTTSLGIGATTRGATGPVLGMFGGKLAKTADLEALDVAKKMAKEGVDAPTIWKETGWGKAPDGQWRFEIDDSVAQTLDIFKTDPQSKSILEQLDFDETGTDLKNALKHEDFATAYPRDFEDMAVVAKPYSHGGSYSDGTITAPMLDYRRTNEIGVVDKSTILHEGQHAIQDVEGFARGGQPGEFTTSASESQIKFDDLQRSVDQMQNAAKTDAKIMMADPTQSTQVKKAINKYSDQIGDGPYDLSETDAVAEYILDSDPVFKSQIKQMNEARWARKEQPHDTYRRLHGEAEARAVQDRMNMSAAERRQNFPEYMTRDDLIIRGLLSGDTI